MKLIWTENEDGLDKKDLNDGYKRLLTTFVTPNGETYFADIEGIDGEEISAVFWLKGGEIPSDTTFRTFRGAKRWITNNFKKL